MGGHVDIHATGVHFVQIYQAFVKVLVKPGARQSFNESMSIQYTQLIGLVEEDGGIGVGGKLQPLLGHILIARFEDLGSDIDEDRDLRRLSAEEFKKAFGAEPLATTIFGLHVLAVVPLEQHVSYHCIGAMQLRKIVLVNRQRQ